ncbi:DUF3159 domain-containing protein [Serinibacter salmoneus]|uniref:Uncharacterized protein DUF3159 n=1 Tax=Serinibacter salmoneus TaxID=556530 RepID=A0A2A9D120_9MICO|nr:DUF3159 domain-containing protein [Serinibacter salmoneus]PFG19549.1 uncharacterized protein DUF3159 [Serinibacter salmoneus]
MTGSQARPGGLGALAGGSSPLAALGGVRGMAESIAPGFVFIVVYLTTSEVVPAVIASVAVALVAVLARLARRSPLTYALGGLLGVAVGAIWAWRSGEASNYYVWGLITNAGFLLGVLVSIAVRWPVVGIVVAALGLSRPHQADAEPPVLETTWRRDPARMRRYTLASWLWAAAFALRLAVQVPLYLGDWVGWLGTARLVMGLPMWALVLWFTWLLVRSPAGPATAAPGSPRPGPDPTDRR